MKLREPRGFFQNTVRRLAEEAMSVTHHDAPEEHYASEVDALERRFTAILRGKLRQPARRAALTQGGTDGR